MIYSDFKVYVLPQFSSNGFKLLHNASKSHVDYGLCSVLRLDHFWNVDEFSIFFLNNCITCYFEMYLLLQFSFSRFEMIQGVPMSHKDNIFIIYCAEFDDRDIFLFLDEYLHLPK